MALGAYWVMIVDWMAMGAARFLSSRVRQYVTMALSAMLLALACSALVPLEAQAVELAWPVPGFGQDRLTQGWHDGCAIDIGGSPANGATVYAAYSGTVTSIFLCGTQHPGNYDYDTCHGYGTGVVIRGDDGRYYMYAHMQSGSIPAAVYYGARVSKWDKLGKVGQTGCAEGPHLHFGIRKYNPLGSQWRVSDAGHFNPLKETYVYDSKPAKPSQASNVKFKNTEAGVGDTVNVSWNAGARATNYAVTLQCITDSRSNQSKNASGTSASFTISKAGTYKVQVVAKNSAGSAAAVSSANQCVIHPNVTVTYEDHDGAVLATKNVRWGGNSAAPSAPTREGYTFSDWSSDGKGVKADTVITAQYKINTYTVKFEDYDGKAIGNLQKIEYEKSATPPTDVPVKDGYVFANWSTEDYKNVTKNLTVKAVYVWGNANLPIVTNITSAKRNAEATGYIVDVKMTNFPDGFTTGKVVTALKTKAGKLVASDTRSVSPSASHEWSESITVLYSGVASQVEVSILGVSDDETTGTPKSKVAKSAIDLGEEWSDWSGNEPPSGSNIISDSRTEYRAKTIRRIQATSQPATPAGYTYTGSQPIGSYTNWGSWSGWSTTNPGSSTTLRDVAKRTTYRYFVFRCSNCGTRDDLGGACSHCGKYTLVWTEEWDATSGASIGGSKWGNRNKVTRNGQVWYYERPGTANGMNNGTTGQVTRTEYRYRTRAAYNYYMYKQTEFSAWQASPIATSDSTPDVETRIAYRFKSNSTEIPTYNYKHYKYLNLNTGKYVYTYTKAYADSQGFPGEWEYNQSYSELKVHSTVDEGIAIYNGLGENSWYRADVNQESASTIYEVMGSLEDAQGVPRTLSGKVEGSAGKIATLVVYKGKNSDPTASQIEYVGQTVIENDGSYSFAYTTKEEPTVKTGDFVLTVGIEGATNYTNVGLIEAPKPSYVVEFMTEDGQKIGETQTVLEGGVASAPEPPQIEGYEFTNWDTGLSNVHDNMVVTAMYKKKSCTVIFVDYEEGEDGDALHPELEVAQFAYGDPLKANDVPVKAGKKFSKWVDESGAEVESVTGDMVVTASYDRGLYTVRFLDWDGNVVSEQEVEAGSAAEAPKLDTAPSSDEVFAGWDSGGMEDFVQEDLAIKPLAEFRESAGMPTFNITEGSYEGAQKVEITPADENDELYYAIVDLPSQAASDEGVGSTMGELAGERYTGPITVSRSAAVLAYASADRKKNSSIAELDLVIENAAEPVAVRGDVNGDGEVTMADVVKANRCVIGKVTLSDAEFAAADVTGDGDVTIADVVKMNRYVIGNIDEL